MFTIDLSDDALEELLHFRKRDNTIIFDEIEQVFFNVPLVLAPDVKHSQTEPRFHALGRTTAGRLLHITFTLRFEGRKIRPISARDMHRKERRVYEEST